MADNNIDPGELKLPQGVRVVTADDLFERCRTSLTSSDPQVHRGALTALSFLPWSEELVPLCISLLEGDDERARSRAVSALHGQGPRAAEALPALKSLLGTTEDAAAQQCELAIESIEGKRTKKSQDQRNNAQRIVRAYRDRRP